MPPNTRRQLLKNQYTDWPNYRFAQIEQALFTPGWHTWESVTSLPRDQRTWIENAVPWMSVTASTLQVSAKKDTYKAALTLHDGQQIESVLMRNARDAWTICASSQVGCAMACVFCATGKMGLKRQLTEDEIVDQHRFWRTFLETHPEVGGRISNIVMMGMGEPLANYVALKSALNTWLTYTDLGVTNITVSTVGVLPRLEQILTDKEFPHVRLAISLHSAVPETRKRIVPTSFEQFLPSLANWARRYLEVLGNRRHHITFEYVMLKGINDSDHEAQALAHFVQNIGHARVNLIPYNFTDLGLDRSTDNQIERFLDILEQQGVTATRRRTMGDDIAAACGQLIKLQAK